MHLAEVRQRELRMSVQAHRVYLSFFILTMKSMVDLIKQ